MIQKIDHLIILTPDPYETSKQIEEAFGLVAPPVMDFGMFASAMFTFGNVNKEDLVLCYTLNIDLKVKNEQFN